MINLDEYSDIGTHWIALYVNDKTVTYFDSFGVEHIPKRLKNLLKELLINLQLQQIFLEHKHMTQLCVVIFVLDLLILCLKIKA